MGLIWTLLGILVFVGLMVAVLVVIKGESLYDHDDKNR